MDYSLIALGSPFDRLLEPLFNICFGPTARIFCVCAFIQPFLGWILGKEIDIFGEAGAKIIGIATVLGAANLLLEVFLQR